MTGMSFCDFIKRDSVDALTEDLRSLHTWESSLGVQAQTAAIVLAMRDLERTVVRLDSAATRLQWTAVGVGALGVIAGAVIPFLVA